MMHSDAKTMPLLEVVGEILKLAGKAAVALKNEGRINVPHVAVQYLLRPAHMSAAVFTIWVMPHM